VPTFLVGLAAFLAVWQGWVHVAARDPADSFLDNLGALRAAAEKLNPDRDELKKLLERTTKEAVAFPEYGPLADFAIGSGYVRVAEIAAEPGEAVTAWTLARQHFDKVKGDQLTAPIDQAKLAFRAAKARAATFPASATPAEIHLTRTLLALVPPNEPPGEGNRLAGELSLRFNPPDAAGAKHFLTLYVAESGFVTPPANVARAKLRLSEVCLMLGESEKAREWLELIKDAPADVMLSRSAQLARLLMADGKWAPAAKEWEAVRSAHGAAPTLKSLAAYYLGQCLTMTDPPDRAAAMKLFEEASKSDAAEGPAAAVRLAELLLQTDDPEKHTEAAAVLSAAAKRLAGPNGYANQLLPVHEARAAFELGLQVLQKDAAFEPAVQVADAYAAISASGRDREKRAELMVAWGTALKKTNGSFQPKFTAAADDYLELAAAQTAPEGKVELLRRAASTYRLAGNTTAAVSALEQVVRMPDLPESAAGAAWLEYAEVLVVAKRPDEVIPIFNKVMASNSSASIVARYRMARSLLDTQNAQLAPLGLALLEQVAGQSSVPPADAGTHEIALVELSHEYIRRAAFADAESRLSVQLSRYPNGPEAAYGKLLKGVCLLQLASAKKAPTDPEPSNAPKMRAEALKLFQDVVDDVDRREKAGPVTERDRYLWQLASLRVAQAYYQLGEADRALSAVAPVVQRCRGTVEELIALSVMYHAQKQKGQTGVMLTLRDRMKDVFEELKKKPGAFKADKGEYSQAYWETVWFNDPK
jgi:tetratricopeptide (TPR) repeat protein